MNDATNVVEVCVTTDLVNNAFATMKKMRMTKKTVATSLYTLPTRCSSLTFRTTAFTSEMEKTWSPSASASINIFEIVGSWSKKCGINSLALFLWGDVESPEGLIVAILFCCGSGKREGKREGKGREGTR